MAINEARALKLGQEALDHLTETHPDMLKWARNPPIFRNLRLKQFLFDYCWVVYASGFRYAVIEAKFPHLQKAFKDFDPEALSRMRSIRSVLKIFNNERKAKSFLSGAQTIIREGFIPFKRQLLKDGEQALEKLPGIGPITKDHLARNIGLADLPKADRWLERAAKLCATLSVEAPSEKELVNELVAFIASQLGESQHVIDVAIWAYGKDGKLQKF
jgi:thermostable 8-oxoguanine DNA glycosylase